MASVATTQLHSPIEPLVSVEGLTKRFPTNWDFLGRPIAWLPAVEDVTLEIRHGETLALVGESGSGKSTLARLILRLIPATDGMVRFGGWNVFELGRRDLTRFRSRAQIIFQDPFESLDPRYTGERIVTEGMRHLHLSKEQRRDRARELLDTVHLPRDAGNRFPHEFSGGQRQRLSIARALAVNPNFVIADEPVSALDVSMQSQILNLMRDLQRQFGLTYLFISHDMSVVRHMADRIAVMYLGRLVEVAPADELFGNPLHPYTQTLLSAVPGLLTGQKRSRIRASGEASFSDDRPSCKFVNRCFRSLERCHVEVPPLERNERSPDHWVACFNPATQGIE